MSVIDQNDFSTIAEGIVVTDLNNKLLSANRAAETMLGFSTDRAKGHEIIYLKNENLTSFFNHEFRSINNDHVVREIMIPDSNEITVTFKLPCPRF